MIIIGVHIPTARRNVPGHVSSNKPLYDLVRGFKDVQILSGHIAKCYAVDVVTERSHKLHQRRHYITLEVAGIAYCYLRVGHGKKCPLFFLGY